MIIIAINRFVSFVNFHNRFDKALTEKKFVTQGPTVSMSMKLSVGELTLIKGFVLIVSELSFSVKQFVGKLNL